VSEADAEHQGAAGEKQGVIMVCMTTARLRAPHIPCKREHCQTCGAEVWVDATVRHDACICTDCALAQGEKIQFSPHPGVEATLRRHGMSQAEIERAAHRARRFLRGARRQGGSRSERRPRMLRHVAGGLEGPLGTLTSVVLVCLMFLGLFYGLYRMLEPAAAPLPFIGDVWLVGAWAVLLGIVSAAAYYRR